MRKRTRRCLSLALLAVVMGFVPACATNHLFEWSRGNRSIYPATTKDKAQFIRPLGTILIFPVALTWDVATAPFQWLWGTYPYGDEMHPNDQLD